MEAEQILAEIKQIKTDLENYYVLGHADYDPGLYHQILHPEWKMFHMEGGKLVQVDREEFCRWYAPENRDPDLVWHFEILSVDVTGDVGSAKLSLENQKVRYLDYLNMMKIDGKWWIVNKIYHESIPK